MTTKIYISQNWFSGINLISPIKSILICHYTLRIQHYNLVEEKDDREKNKKLRMSNRT